MGFLGLGLGFVGAMVPVLPAFPFLVLAAFGFSRGSEKLHTRFINSKLYKNNLESFLSGRGMTKAAKARVLLTISVVFIIGIIAVRRFPWIQALLGFIWLCHLIGFIFGIKTIKEEEGGTK